MRTLSRGRRAIGWIEEYCRIPNGPDRGKPVRLTPEQREIVRQIYDHPDSPQGRPVTGMLAGYLALLHTAGPEALQRNFRPQLEVDIWTTWNAASDDLRAVLNRDGAGIICPELGTRWPVAA